MLWLFYHEQHINTVRNIIIGRTLIRPSLVLSLSSARPAFLYIHNLERFPPVSIPKTLRTFLVFKIHPVKNIKYDFLCNLGALGKLPKKTSENTLHLVTILAHKYSFTI